MPIAPRRTLLCAVLALAALLGLPATQARAQVGSTTDIITGVIRGQDGSPVPDVAVEAMSLETQITRRARTDARGRYTILFPDGGGQYRMTARFVGMAPREAMLARQADEDRLVWNVSLASNVVVLDPVTVRSGRQPVQTLDRPTPGSTERALGPDQLARLPMDVTDLALLATLSPGVVALDATDTTGAAFSVAGLGPEANALMLDGLLFGNGAIPQDALRQTRVITSTYDVARGQFSGGLIASTTRGGTNVVTGSSQYQLREDDLSATAEEDSPFAQGFTQHVISGGLGGPIARDRLFTFASVQARLRSDPQQTLLSAADPDFTRLGVNPDSVDRFLAVVSGLGVPPAIVATGNTRANDNYSALLRIDYLLSGAHTLTLRGDWRGVSQDPSRLGPLALPMTGGLIESGGGGVMASIASRFGNRVINEVRAYAQSSRNDGSAFTQLPQGRVQIASDLPDSARGIATLVFGGNSGLPTRTRSSSIELTDELSWIPGAGGHRFKVGGLFLIDRSSNLLGGNRLGTFTYTSLAALQAGQPSVFTRTLESPERKSESTSWAFYAGDVWMASRPVQITYGVRLEGSGFRNAPAYNPAVDAAFGRRTDRLPSEVHLSPRIGFTLTLGGGQPAFGRPFTPPALVVRGGIGEFRSPMPAQLVAQARAGTGLTNSSAEIICIGPGVPTPDWLAYRADPATIPDECASGGPPPPSGVQAPRLVTLLGDDFAAPRAWRGSLAFERSLTQLSRLSVEGSFARGVSLTSFRDLNLVPAPAFTLASEAGRPVYVSPSDIAPISGAPRFAASRVDSAFGRVLEAGSGLASRTVQVTVGVGGIVRRGILLQTSYTWQRVRDQAVGVRGGNTAGDPNVAEWARSSLERRHNFLLTMTYPFGPALELTSIGRLSSGTPFTPTVAGDVNGDGAWNDRAFVFAPGASGAEQVAMQRLLAAASPRVRDCLTRQAGAVAGRNSCTGPWQGTLDFQLNWRPAGFGLNRRLMVSIVTVNFLHGLDELMHGAAGAKGWGLTPRPDGTLLYVSAFDTSSQRYVYQVNERFGATGGSATAFRPPFQIGVQMRLTIGPDRARQALDQLRGARGGGGGGGRGGLGGVGGGGPGALLERLEQFLPNPARIALSMKDSIGLDSTQVARITLLNDSLNARNQARIDSLMGIVAREGQNPDQARMMGVLRPAMEAVRADVVRTGEAVRGILTAEQWARVSARLRPAQGPGMRPGQGPGDRGRP